MRRTAEDAARTRVALLEAALMSFEEKGWRGATFEHVAERAGVTRGALHHHFRDKQALLIAALEWGWSDYEQRLFAGIDDESESGAREKIEALLSHFVRLLTGDPRFRALACLTRRRPSSMRPRVGMKANCTMACGLARRMQKLRQNSIELKLI